MGRREGGERGIEVERYGGEEEETGRGLSGEHSCGRGRKGSKVGSWWGGG